ncbi:MarR family winged helix-turn-helix transcriptional regulator [Sphingomonas sp. ASY06-1R]|uniref:MarR family winged helix-turn-helix transcriptional regulator n=1 Tax=Sphingomonas sp. ASY06-1R TaxID=3445771 RepID=UPI003FA323EB
MSDASEDYSRTFGGEALGARLRRLSERIDRDGTRIYAEHGIRFEQRWYGVLRQLVANGPMSVGQIAAALHISHASVSEARRSLEKAGIVDNTPSPEDGRRRMLTLTAEGRTLWDSLSPLWDDFNTVAKELNDEAQDVVRLLDRLDDALARRSMYDRIMDKVSARTMTR